MPPPQACVAMERFLVMILSPLMLAITERALAVVAGVAYFYTLFAVLLMGKKDEVLPVQLVATTGLFILLGVLFRMYLRAWVLLAIQFVQNHFPTFMLLVRCASSWWVWSSLPPRFTTMTTAGTYSKLCFSSVSISSSAAP
ncbi:hypothetical protein BRARA_J01415 [Brassica rapa]|uniref:Uncharacterized protein n=1 Tax=Brassica campestris TaxID=3711 RepID=A0A397XPF6_BRACM|nr:hypothetical protein BRARA_J01415 [Brassica rapa]